MSEDSKPALSVTEPAPQAEGTGPQAFPVANRDGVRLAFESGSYPYGRRLGSAAYEAEKAQLQAELLCRRA